MRLKNPWWIVFGSILGLVVSVGPIMQFTFGVLLKPISEEFGWNRGTISGALVVGLVCTGLMTPVIGRLVDRYGVRRVALPSIVLFSLMVAAASLTSSTPLVFIAIYGLMGITAAGQNSLIYSKAIAATFDDRRGLALGVANAGVGFGAALIPQFAQYLIGSVGWRGAYVGLGLLTFVLGTFAVATFIREPVPLPRDAGAGRAAAPVLPGVSGWDALKTRHFWLLVIPFFVVAAAANGSITHVVPLLTDRGISPQNATAALSMAGLALIAGRVIAGYLLDYVFAPYIAVVFIACPLVGVLLLTVAHGTAVASIATVLTGIAVGAEVDLIAYFVSRYLGLRSFGEIFGYLFLMFMLGNGIGPFVMGAVFDRAGSYNPVLWGFAAALVIAAALILRMGPYVYPAPSRKKRSS